MRGVLVLLLTVCFAVSVTAQPPAYDGKVIILTNSSSSGKSLTLVTGPIPAAGVDGMSGAVVTLDRCTVRFVHSHPSGDELVVTLGNANSRVEYGLFLANGTRVVTTNGTAPGQFFLFPRGLMHWQANRGCCPATFVATFNSAVPGTVQLNPIVLGLPDNVKQPYFNSTSLGAPAGQFTLDQACLQRCRNVTCPAAAAGNFA